MGLVSARSITNFCAPLIQTGRYRAADWARVAAHPACSGAQGRTKLKHRLLRTNATAREVQTRALSLVCRVD